MPQTIRNTHELREGDEVRYYGNLFRLHTRQVHKRADDLKHDPAGTVTFKTELLEFSEGSMPRHWAETWVIQGNSRATWCVEQEAA